MKIVKWDSKHKVIPIKLRPGIVSELQKQPQTGKGYQLCSITFKGGVLHTGVPVLCFDEAWIHDTFQNASIKSIKVDQSNT